MPIKEKMCAVPCNCVILVFSVYLNLNEVFFRDLHNSGVASNKPNFALQHIGLKDWKMSAHLLYYFWRYNPSSVLLCQNTQPFRILMCANDFSHMRPTACRNKANPSSNMDNEGCLHMHQHLRRSDLFLRHAEGSPYVRTGHSQTDCVL